jgi:hypothetical protein
MIIYLFIYLFIILIHIYDLSEQGKIKLSLFRIMFTIKKKKEIILMSGNPVHSSKRFLV